MRLWGYLATGWAIVFACAHFFWALGGRTGLDISAGQQLASERPGWFVAGGLWGVGVLCLLGVLLAFGLTRAEPPMARLLKIVGWAIGVLLLLRGVGVELLILFGAPAVSADQKFWTLVLWNPWFILGGVLFVLAARNFANLTAPSSGPIGP